MAWNYFEDFKTQMDKVAIGFDEFLNTTPSIDVPKSNYPPYNIRKYLDKNACIEIACAGFKQSELSVQTDETYVYVKGHKEEQDDNSGYSHKGIATRDFELKFVINNSVVDTVTFTDGILKINLKNKLSSLTRTVEINKPQDLTLYAAGLLVEGKLSKE